MNANRPIVDVKPIHQLVATCSRPLVVSVVSVPAYVSKVTSLSAGVSVRKWQRNRTMAFIQVVHHHQQHCLLTTTSVLLWHGMLSWRTLPTSATHTSLSWNSTGPVFLAASSSDMLARMSLTSHEEIGRVGRTRMLRGSSQSDVRDMPLDDDTAATTSVTRPSVPAGADRPTFQIELRGVVTRYVSAKLRQYGRWRCKATVWRRQYATYLPPGDATWSRPAAFVARVVFIDE